MEVHLLIGEAQSKESSKAIQACNDYLRMGAGRSLAKLHSYYAENNHNTPPTSVLGTLKHWSSKYTWVSRAEQWDAQTEERKTVEYDLAMKNGLALDYERVNSLKRLALFLEGEIYEQGADGRYHNVWLPDVKAVDGIKYDIERFNGSIFTQYRGTLDDLAKETGGRIAKQEIDTAVQIKDDRFEKSLAKMFENDKSL